MAGVALPTSERAREVAELLRAKYAMGTCLNQVFGSTGPAGLPTIVGPLTVAFMAKPRTAALGGTAIEEDILARRTVRFEPRRGLP